MKPWFIFLFLGLISCSKKESGSELSESLPTSTLTFSLDSLVKKDCLGENCASLRLVWPVANGTEFSSDMNQSIEERVNGMLLFGDVISKDRDTLVMDYFQSFTEFKGEFPDSPGEWEVDSEGELTYQSDSTISLQFTWMTNMGGAHPNHGQDFLNFDAKTGEALSVDHLVRNEKVLLDLAEKKFREFHQVDEGVSLADDGRFFLPEKGFFLANAMGFKEDKFWIVYIPYEIGPYALGYTELQFTKEELGEMVRW